MARPTRTNAEYFYHPATFRNDRRVKAIRARYGACGYGLLLMLIELLTDADNTALATDEMELELLAGDLSATVEDVTSLIQAAEKVGLFGRNDAGLLKCPQLDEWLAPVFEKRNRARNTPSTPKLSQADTETLVTVSETPPVKESTEQERTGEERKGKKQEASLRSADAATAAASQPEKKIEPLSDTNVGDTLESPPVEAPHTGGASDVPTRKAAPVKFAAPSYDEILTYMVSQRPNNAATEMERTAAKCYGYYSGNGWKVGRNPMRDWKGACQTFLADVPKATARTSQAMALPVQQPAYGNGYARQTSQVSIRTAAIAQADAMVDAMAGSYKPYDLSK